MSDRFIVLGYVKYKTENPNSIKELMHTVIQRLD